MAKRQVIKALLDLRKAAPGLFEEAIINGVCPHDAGLKSEKESECGYAETDRAFVIGYCGECWRLALEGKEAEMA